MAPETLLFPVGPMSFDDVELFGLMICTPRVDIETVWDVSWDAVFDTALAQKPDGPWATVHRMADSVEIAAGKGRDLRLDHVIRLSRLVGGLYDPAGFGDLTDDMNAYALMRAMAEYLPKVTLMKDARSQPVAIDIKDGADGAKFVGAIGRDGDAGYLYVTHTPDMLVKLIETSFGLNLPDWVGFVMAQVAPGQGWIGQAMHDLFGVSFQPMIRWRTTDGLTYPVPEERVQSLIVALYRAADIAGGADSAGGEIALHNWAPVVEMWRFDL
ncbi:MAG: hypothetical protein WA790_01350 [Sulfitobacter sp.]